MKFTMAGWERLREPARFYQAAIVNTAFGFSAYALLVRLGLNIFLAQAISHVLGMAFNYITYSRHVFRKTAPAKTRFVIHYAVYYFFNLAALALFAHLIKSPYLAGAATTVTVSLLNYFALKHLVFRTPRRPRFDEVKHRVARTTARR